MDFISNYLILHFREFCYVKMSKTPHKVSFCWHVWFCDILTRIFAPIFCSKSTSSWQTMAKGSYFCFRILLHFTRKDFISSQFKSDLNFEKLLWHCTFENHHNFYRQRKMVFLYRLGFCLHIIITSFHDLATEHSVQCRHKCNIFQNKKVRKK